MKSDVSVCGIDCGAVCSECNKSEELKNNPCKGCNSIKGQVFWTAYMNLTTCPIYSCIETKKLKHCGECEELPCDIWIAIKDPSVSDEWHKQNIAERVELLKKL
jgi:hypothetical protein